MKIVHAHYAIIRQFVCRVSLRIDPDDWNTFADELNKYIPGIGVLPVATLFSKLKISTSGLKLKFQMVDVLSTFLLQVTTVHSIDHDGMVKTFKDSGTDILKSTN